MYNRVRRKMHRQYLICLVLMLQHIYEARSISIPATNGDLYKRHNDEPEDNNIIDFDSEYDKKFIKKYENWRSQNNLRKDTNKYTIVKEESIKVDLSASTTSEMPLPMEITTEAKKENNDPGAKNITIEFSTTNPVQIVKTTESDVSVIPLELLSTIDPPNIIDSTTEPDLTVIPLSTTKKSLPNVEVDETVTLPISTESVDETTTELLLDDFTESGKFVAIEKNVSEIFNSSNKENFNTSNNNEEVNRNHTDIDTSKNDAKHSNKTFFTPKDTTSHDIQANATEIKITVDRNDGTVSEEYHETQSEETEVPVFTAIDIEVADEVPEDYYDSKDLIPTKAPSTDALSVLFGFAGSVVESVVESVAERVVPKGIYDLFKRMQRQSEALEAEKLRSREENGGLGSFGRGILKSISSGLSKPLSQLMGARDNGSLDSDRGFVSSLASGVSSVATSLVDTFKDRVQAIYPGTVWCGDGRSATARSSELGLFFFTDTCCRQHDACKMYIRAGETKHGLTNTGLFTRGSNVTCTLTLAESLVRFRGVLAAEALAPAAGSSRSPSGERPRLRVLREPPRLLETASRARDVSRISLIFRSHELADQTRFPDTGRSQHEHPVSAEARAGVSRGSQRTWGGGAGPRLGAGRARRHRRVGPGPPRAQRIPTINHTFAC